MIPHETMYQTLRDRIIRHQYTPGHILNEKALAKEFGVSRTPLREVLMRLEWERMVRVIPRTGTMVAPIELGAIHRAFQVRIEIEELVGQLAGRGITPEGLTAIESLEDECRRLRSEPDLARLMDVEFQFRRLLYEAAGNDILSEISERLYQITVRVWFVVAHHTPWEEEVASLEEEIERTLAALKTGDPAQAAAIRRTYLLKFVDRVKALF
jgi:DNA-binding GntR family transcriptional regulator